MMKVKFGDAGVVVETLAAARGCRKIAGKRARSAEEAAADP